MTECCSWTLKIKYCRDLCNNMVLYLCSGSEGHHLRAAQDCFWRWVWVQQQRQHWEAQVHVHTRLQKTGLHRKFSYITLLFALLTLIWQYWKKNKMFFIVLYAYLANSESVVKLHFSMWVQARMCHLRPKLNKAPSSFHELWPRIVFDIFVYVAKAICPLIISLWLHISKRCLNPLRLG